MEQPNYERQKLLAFADAVGQMAERWAIDCVLAVGSIDPETLKYTGTANARCSIRTSRAYLSKLIDVHYHQDLLANSINED